MYDFLVIGAGYSGAVISRLIAEELDKKVLVVDQRDHIAGNAYDFKSHGGVLAHKYGPHIFHTTLKSVWDFLSRFTDWYYYHHRVKAVIEGENVPVPFNFNSIYQLFPNRFASNLEDELLSQFEYGQKIPIMELKKISGNLDFLATYIYDNLYKGYTQKQWGLSPEELDSSVTARVPVYLSRDNRYFQDPYQGIPSKGYTEMFRSILDHPNIEVKLRTAFKDIENQISFDKLVYTGPIDEFFDFTFGELPYRSLHFEFRNYNKPFYQEVAQLNFPNNYDFTRINEFKYYNEDRTDETVISVEYPRPYLKNENDPYYPIPKEDNNKKYLQYRNEAKKLKNVIFIGRLAEYKYYNMDQTIARAIKIFKKEFGR